MAKKGRPTLLNKHLKELCASMAKQKGMTMRKMAQSLGIAESTLYLWFQKDKDLSETVKSSFDLADELVEIALFQRAIGYQHDEEKIFCEKGRVTRVKTVKQYAPSEQAANLWLINRRPERWQNKGSEPDEQTEIAIKIAGDESDL